MSTAANPKSDHGAEYWNGEGGQTWLANIDATEQLLLPLSAELLARAAPAPGERVLDIGCGGGQTSRELARYVAPDGSVLGLDVSEPILAIAQERGTDIDNLSFVLDDASTAILAPETYDLVFSRFGVMFFEDPVAAFANIMPSMKRDGRLVFMCWRLPDENPWLSEPVRAAMELVPPEVPPDPRAPGPFAMADADYTSGILQAAGLKDVNVEAVDHDMTWPDVPTALAYLGEMGPLGRLGRENPDRKDEILGAARSVLERHASEAGVAMARAAWVISARREPG